MKTRVLIFAALFVMLTPSCIQDDISIDGEQSAMGEVGEKISGSADVEGIENASATVTSLVDGISTFRGIATITNPAILNVISNIPEFKVSGNTVTVNDLKFKVTKEGVESKNPAYPGIIVNYGSKVGDKYPVKNGIEREVTYKSVDDDYPYYFFDIKVIKVEESPSVFPGIKKIVYVANHRFGIVGIEVTLDDNNTLNFLTGGKAEN